MLDDAEPVGGRFRIGFPVFPKTHHLGPGAPVNNSVTHCSNRFEVRGLSEYTQRLHSNVRNAKRLVWEVHTTWTITVWVSIAGLKAYIWLTKFPNDQVFESCETIENNCLYTRDSTKRSRASTGFRWRPSDAVTLTKDNLSCDAANAHREELSRNQVGRSTCVFESPKFEVDET